MPITIRKIELFCSLLFFSPTSLQRAKNACFSLIFPEKSAFRNGFELRRSDVKKDFFFNIFRRRSVGRIIFRQLPLFSDKYRQFRYIPKNSKSIWQQCHVGSNPTVCAKYHYSILHRVVIFCCRFVKFRSYFYRHLPFIFK